MTIRTTAIATLLLLSSAGVSAQGGSNSQAGGLPALAAELAALKAQVAALEAGVATPAYPDVYAGTYTVMILESARYACNDTNDPADYFGTPGGVVAYLQNQGISSTSTLSSVTQVLSDGYTLEIPAHITSRQELRLSGTYGSDPIADDAITIGINADGSFDFASEPDLSFGGQMADDGSSFSILASAQWAEEDCTDAFTALIIGMRQ
jgi:hypothetical protein